LILDSSALVALLVGEPRAAAVARALAAAEGRAMGAPTLLEAGMVLSSRLKRDSQPTLNAFLAYWQVQEIPFGSEHWREALRAFGRFGKGKHAAGLNMGDCLTYAVAKLAGEPLLCIGNDFAKTDLELVPLEQ
jgi:ribonuclease VapC